MSRDQSWPLKLNTVIHCLLLGILGDGSGDSSGSSNDEVPVVYDARTRTAPDPRLLRQLPKCPKIRKMFNWTAEDYEQYDQYLIAKWNLFGFPPEDRVYVVSCWLHFVINN